MISCQPIRVKLETNLNLYRPLALFIGLRYLRAERKGQFISIITTISFIGITLGVTALITVLSIMNGFDRQIRNKILVILPSVKVYQEAGKFCDWKVLSEHLKRNIPEITGTAPIIEGQGILLANGANSFTLLQGIDPTLEKSVVPISKYITRNGGGVESLQPGSFNIILGSNLAKSLGVGIGNKVTMIVPRESLTPTGIEPKLRQFNVSGLFSIDYQYDSYYALMNIQDAAKILRMGKAISALQISTSDIQRAAFLKNYLDSKFQGSCNIHVFFLCSMCRT